MSVHEISRRLINGIWRTVDAEENGNGGSQPQTQTATITTDADTFEIEHDFDLDHATVAYVTSTLLSVVADGETFGPDPSDILADFNWYRYGRDALGFTTTEPLHWLKDTPYDGGALPLLTHAGGGFVAETLRVRALIMDSDFNIYAGPNNPTATWRVDVEYL